MGPPDTTVLSVGSLPGDGPPGDGEPGSVGDSPPASDYENACRALAITLVANIPVILWGPPGTGKTSVVEQIAAANDWQLFTVIAAVSDPTDFNGLPRQDRGRTRTSPPDWAVSVAEAGGGVVFLDEITTAPPAVQAALLRPVLDRVVGELPLPAGTRFVAAANPPVRGRAGWDLSAPLASRFAHLQWHADSEQIGDGFLYGFYPVELPVLDPQLVADGRAGARARLAEFFRLRPDLLLATPEPGQRSGVPWPSPRSWEMAAELLGHGRAADVGSDVQLLLVASVVGAPAAREFLHWLEQRDLVDIEAALSAGTDATGLFGDGPLGGELGADLVSTVCRALVSSVTADPAPQRCDTAVNVILYGLARSGHADLAAMAVRRLGPVLADAGTTISPEAFDLFAELLVRTGSGGGDQ